MQTIDVLVCKPDGTQAIETREVPDDYFPEPQAPEPTTEERVTALEDAIAEGLNLYEGDVGNG